MFKKLSIILLLGIIVFINFDTNIALCKQNKSTQKLYNYNSRGQIQGYTKVTYSNNKITKIETRDNGGRRLSVSKVR